MRIPSGVVDQYAYFTAIDIDDYVSRMTGQSGFAVYRSRNGGAATAMTTPTIAELSAGNMPGEYSLLLDEDMTLDAGDDSQAMIFLVTLSGMVPVKIEIELYRPKITAGETLTVASGIGSANATQISGDSTAADNAESFFDGTGYAGTNNVIPTVTTVGTLTTYTGNTPQTGDSYAIVNSGTHGNAAIKGYVDDIGTAGAGLTAVPWNAAWDAEVQSEVDDALVAQNLDHLVKIAVDTNFATTVHLDSVIGQLADNGTTATFDRTTDSLEALQAEHDATQAKVDTVDDFLDTEIAAIKTVTDAIGATGTGLSAIPWNAAWDTEVQSECNDALVANNLDHLVLSAVDTDFATTVHLNSVIGHLADNGTSATFDRTTDSLEALNGLTVTVGAVADAVWDEATSGHTTGGTFGEQCKTDIDAILVVTAAIGTTGTGLSAIPWNAAWDTEVQSECNDALVANNLDHLLLSAVDTDFATTVHLNSVVGHIADNGTSATFDRTTDSLEALQAEHDTSQSKLDTIDDFLDSEISTLVTNVAAILDDTGTSGCVLTSAERNSVADALLDRAAGVETNRTLRQALRLVLAACVGKLSGAATSTVTIRDTNDGTNRITATVDSSGNRSAVTLDAS